MKKILALAICLGVFPASAKEGDTNKYSSSLKKHVKEIVFRKGEKQFFPCRKKVKVFIQGTPLQKETTKNYLKGVGALVGSEFEFVDKRVKDKEIFSSQFSDFTAFNFYFGKQSDIEKVARKHMDLRSKIVNSLVHYRAVSAFCNMDDTLGSVDFYLDSKRLKEEELNRVLFESIVRAYGFRGKGKTRIESSYFFDKEPKKAKFGEFDKKLLKFLYTDVKPGARYSHISTALKNNWVKDK